MKTKGEDIARKILELAVIFLFNLILFALSMLVFDISFPSRLLYSLTNGVWMTFLLIPIVEKLRFKRKLNHGTSKL
ncbi:MAG: hypothetical protein JXB49_34600 [Bacteroidales bacterium]|nr:hypothetical protein [Bacteroidales bacterium]